MNSIPNRIELIIKYYNMSYNSFAKSLGLANGTGIKTMIDNNRNPQNQTLNKIVNSYPEIDMIWLRTGTGQMINNLSKSVSINDDLTVTAQQIYCKLDEDSARYKDMLSNKLKEDREYYNNDSDHSQNIIRILEGFKTLESKVEHYALQASSSVIDKITKATNLQNKLLIDSLTKIKHLETDLEDIKTFMAANFELDKMNKKKSKQIKKLIPR